MYECRDALTSGLRGREKTYLTVSRGFYWPRQQESVRKYIRACEPLPIPAVCWQFVSMDFVFGFPKDVHRNYGIRVFVDRFSKMVHLVAEPESIKSQVCARVFIDTIFLLHWLPRELVSVWDIHFTEEFWKSVFRSFGKSLNMSTSDHKKTDGQTKRVNRVLEELLRGYVHSFTSCCEFLPMAKFAINNSVHASTAHTPFFVNGLRHPHSPASLHDHVAAIDIDDDDDDDAGIFFGIADDCHKEEGDALTGEDDVLSAVRSKRTAVDKDESAKEFLLTREAVVRFV
uniref:Integrase catalytic domain-containing protein n=1 Tax=Peronospora matthiolae TaxID=2874970 RepID=A0AAV1U5L5_9STRA